MAVPFDEFLPEVLLQSVDPSVLSVDADFDEIITKADQSPRCRQLVENPLCEKGFDPGIVK